MNNLDMLWAYIEMKVPPGGIPGHDDRQYRDLKRFYETKPEERKLRGRDLVNNPLKVCALAPEGGELFQLGESKELAVAAYLLAYSIIKNCDYEGLQGLKQRLGGYPTVSLLKKLNEGLKNLLTKGDLVESERFPVNLELKNFGSVAFKKRTQEACIAAAEDAFGRALYLLTTMNERWPASSTGIPEQFKQTFRDYFDDPDGKVDVGKLGFFSNSAVKMAMFVNMNKVNKALYYRSFNPRSFFSSQPRWAVARAVLDSVFRGLQEKMVRLYFGGRTFVPQDNAYARICVNDDHPRRINVHLAEDFFNKHGVRAIKGLSLSRAGILIHECSHTLAGTEDVEYGAADCKALAQNESALTNADSYAFFVDDALG